MTILSARRAAAVAALTFFAGTAFAAAEAPPRLMCATHEALDCEAGTACLKGRAAELGAPPFMRIDLEKMTIGGARRSTPIVSIQKLPDTVLLQGTEMGYAWTVAIGTADGSMSATLVNREGAFVLFGSCTAL